MRMRSLREWPVVALELVALVALDPSCRMNRRQVIAVIPETTAQELWESEHAGAARAARSYGWDVYWNGPSREDDYPRQAQIVKQEIARKVTGLILSPDHDVVLISAVRAALARKIPTVIVGSPLGISPGAGLTFILNDDAAAGRLAAERAARWVKPGDSVAVLGVNPNITGTLERAEAFRQSLNRTSAGIRFQERRTTSFSFAEAEQTAEDLIRGDGQLRAIFSLNIDETRAVYGALVNTGALGRIRLIACDQDLDLLHHLRSGGIDSVIAEDTNAMGYQAIQTIHKQLQGEEPNRRLVVQPVLVTQENVDSPAVQQVLDMDWRGAR